MVSIFFALNELKFCQTRFLRFGEKGSLPSWGETSKFHPDRNFFAEFKKTEVKIVVLYQAASSWRFLKHNTWTRLDSLIPHHAFTLTYTIGGLRPECPVEVHTVWIPSHLSWWEHNGKYDWDIWLCWRFSPKLVWRGNSALCWNVFGSLLGQSICYGTGSRVPNQGLLQVLLGSQCCLMPYEQKEVPPSSIDVELLLSPELSRCFDAYFLHYLYLNSMLYAFGTTILSPRLFWL